MTHDVFICHSSKDRTLANAICATLEEHRIRCWIAPRDVIPGLEYAQSIIEAIGRSKLTVLVFSADANTSPHVRRELERTASHGIPILPFRVEDVVPAPSVEYFISDAHWLDAMTPPMEQHLEHLVGTVQLLLERQAAQVGPATAGGTAAGIGAALLEAAPPVPPVTTTPARDAPPPDRPAGGGRSRTLLYAVIAGVVVLAGVITALLMGLGGGDPPETAGEGEGTVAEQAGEEAAAPEAEPVAPESDPAVPPAVEPVVVDFNDGLGEGWTWENEDPDAWSVEGGALRIEVQASPPLHNVALRDLPDSDAWVAHTQLIFDPTAPDHAAGLVLTGEDLGDRVELVWTTEGLKLWTYENGTMVDGTEIMVDQFAPGEWLDASLMIAVDQDVYVAVFSSATTPYWEVDMSPLPAGMTRVGLLAYAAEDADETAVFNHFEVMVDPEALTFE